MFSESLYTSSAKIRARIKHGFKECVSTVKSAPCSFFAGFVTLLRKREVKFSLYLHPRRISEAKRELFALDANVFYLSIFNYAYFNILFLLVFGGVSEGASPFMLVAPSGK